MDFSGVSEFFNNLKGKVSRSADKEGGDAEPRALPDTAKDIYGDVDEVQPAPRKEESGGALEKTEGKEDEAPEELPDMKFSSEKEEKEPAPKPKPKPKREHRIVPESSDKVPEMRDEIAEFEEAITQMYPQGYLERDTGGGGGSESRTSISSDHGFFSEFHQFLEGNELPEVAEELVSKDLLEKMKDYHTHKEEGKPYYFHTRELKEAMREKMLELRDLERDWYVHREKLRREERLLVEKEKEIDDKIGELKHVLGQIKKKEEFRQEAPEERYFHLSSGRVLKSLSDLRTALRVMDDEVFESHVTHERNDFASWVSEVFDRKALAETLADCKSRKEMLDAMAEAERA